MKTPKVTREVFLLDNRNEDDVEDMKLGFAISTVLLQMEKDKRMRSKLNRITERTSE